MNSITRITKVYSVMNQLGEAINFLFTKLKKFEGNSEEECILLTKIGVTFKEMKNDEKALVYLKQAQEKKHAHK